jgi:hypothetical protein
MRERKDIKFDLDLNRTKKQFLNSFLEEVTFNDINKRYESLNDKNGLLDEIKNEKLENKLQEIIEINLEKLNLSNLEIIEKTKTTLPEFHIYQFKNGEIEKEIYSNTPESFTNNLEGEQTLRWKLINTIGEKNTEKVDFNNPESFKLITDESLRIFYQNPNKDNFELIPYENFNDYTNKLVKDLKETNLKEFFIKEKDNFINDMLNMVENKNEIEYISLDKITEYTNNLKSIEDNLLKEYNETPNIKEEYFKTTFQLAVLGDIEDGFLSNVLDLDNEKESYSFNKNETYSDNLLDFFDSELFNNKVINETISYIKKDPYSIIITEDNFFEEAKIEVINDLKSLIRTDDEGDFIFYNDFDKLKYKYETKENEWEKKMEESKTLKETEEKKDYVSELKYELFIDKVLKKEILEMITDELVEENATFTAYENKNILDEFKDVDFNANIADNFYDLINDNLDKFFSSPKEVILGTGYDIKNNFNVDDLTDKELEDKVNEITDYFLPSVAEQVLKDLKEELETFIKYDEDSIQNIKKVDVETLKIDIENNIKEKEDKLKGINKEKDLDREF